jgi:hypothetical protein
MFPHLFNQCRGEAQSRGKEESVMRLVFRRATDSETNEEASDEPESLPNRIHRTLTEYPGTENEKVGTSKCGCELQVARCRACYKLKGLCRWKKLKAGWKKLLTW